MQAWGAVGVTARTNSARRVLRWSAMRWRNRRGAASVEAALGVSIVLIPLCLAGVNAAETEAVAARMDRALQAAIYYAWTNAGSYTNANVQSAASTAYGSASPTLAVNVSTACTCVTSLYRFASSIVCLLPCPLNQTQAKYVTVTETATYTLPAPFPAFPSSKSLNVTGTVRVQ